MTLGSKLKEQRLELNLTQLEVAKKLFVSPQTISRWELDQSLPSISFILELSAIYNVSLDYLLKEDEVVKKAYKNKDSLMKLTAVVLIILYVILFTFLIVNAINSNLRTVPVNEIEAIKIPKKLTNETYLSLKSKSTDITGVDSQYSNGNLYIVVLHKPINLFNKVKEVNLPIKDLAESNHVSLNKIKSIYLVENAEKNYDNAIALQNELKKKIIYTTKN